MAPKLNRRALWKVRGALGALACGVLIALMGISLMGGDILITQSYFFGGVILILGILLAAVGVLSVSSKSK